MGLIQVIVYNASSKLECESHTDQAAANSHDISHDEAIDGVQKDVPLLEVDSNRDDRSAESSASDGKREASAYDIFLQLPKADLHNLCSLLGHEGYVILACFFLNVARNYYILMFLKFS